MNVNSKRFSKCHNGVATVHTFVLVWTSETLIYQRGV